MALTSSGAGAGGRLTSGPVRAAAGGPKAFSWDNDGSDNGDRGLRDGLRVQLRRIQGVTDPGLLERRFMFQCPPLEEFTVEYAHSHTDYETASNGQFSRRGGLQLRTVSFDTLFVDWGSFTLEQGSPEQPTTDAMTDELVRITETGTPFLLSVAHKFPAFGFADFLLPETGPVLQMPATLRTLRITEKAGEVDARYVTASFTEYRDPTATERGKGKRAGGRQLPVTGTIRKDGSFDTGGRRYPRKGQNATLANLAKEFYGKPDLARYIGGYTTDDGRTNGLANWGVNTPIVRHAKYRKGDKKLTIWPVPRFDALTDVSDRGSAAGRAVKGAAIVGNR